jgi:hypothetical protein
VKIDAYTKVVLTVIAAALSVIAIQNSVPIATAQSRVTKVTICDPKLPSYCADVTSGRLMVGR